MKTLIKWLHGIKSFFCFAPKTKHTKESAKWAKILHDFWPEEYDKNGDKLKGGQ